MKIETLGKKEIQEENWGTYLWMMPGNKLLRDQDGNYAMIPSMQGDINRMRALRDEVRAVGITEGQPCFFPGTRPVTDEEYEEQKRRLAFGLTPDPLHAFKEAINGTDQRR